MRCWKCILNAANLNLKDEDQVAVHLGSAQDHPGAGKTLT
jgi:hypothetical protein